jgi:hypothetical protein
MITWSQSKGLMTNHDGVPIGKGYAGNGLGKDNPEDQGLQGIGPVPQGVWNIGQPHLGVHTGPYTMDLTPQPGTDTLGRSAFRIHGDSITDPGNASHGCIILPRAVREAIWNGGDHVLQVVA